jgi:hypothetical protein
MPATAKVPLDCFIVTYCFRRWLPPYVLVRNCKNSKDCGQNNDRTLTHGLLHIEYPRTLPADSLVLSPTNRQARVVSLSVLISYLRYARRKQLGLKFRQMYSMLGRKSELWIENNLLMYKTVLEPIWTHGIPLWGTSSISKIEILQRYQYKVLRGIYLTKSYVQT